MADLIDDANKTADFFLHAALLNWQRGATVAPSGTGHCLHCDAAVEPPRRWCDAECRDAWQQEQGRK